MDAEQRFIFILTLVGVILLCIVALILFIALWPYHVLIGLVLLSLVVLAFLLIIGISVNEGILRHKRVKYHSELPLDHNGRPFYLPQEMKPYQQGGHYD
jgi:predicted lysophospholipase L1 biosynthesis ABC-type transport system permease subunit